VAVLAIDVVVLGFRVGSICIERCSVARSPSIKTAHPSAF
jgi:hypothetical protein